MPARGARALWSKRVPMDLVDRARAGEPRAVEELLAHVRQFVHRYSRARLCRLPSGQELAEDAAQDVCVAVLDALPRYIDTGRPFEAFVQTIASRRVADVLRASYRSPLCVAEIPDEADQAPTPDLAVVRVDEAERALRLLDSLTDQQRTLVRLKVEDELTAEQVATVMDMTPGAVRVAQHRALRRLRNLVEAGS